MDIKEHVDFLIATAAQFEQYYEDEEKLFAAINQLGEEVINSLLRYYDFNSSQSESKNFTPVNFVRNNILLKLQKGVKVESTLVEEIKDRFVTKDLPYFADYLEPIQSAIQEYQIGKRGPFHVWNNTFRILYTFLVLPGIREKVNNSLEAIKHWWWAKSVDAALDVHETA